MIVWIFAATSYWRHSYLRQSPDVSPKLILEIEEIGRSRSNVVTLRVQVINRGKLGVQFAPGFLAGEMLQVRFKDGATGRIVHFQGDDLLWYSPPTPEESFNLVGGMFVGYEEEFKLKAIPKKLTAVAECASYFGREKPRKTLWEGYLKSKEISIQ